MNDLLQLAVVLLIVASALAYLGVRVWRWFTNRQGTGCGGCHGCGSTHAKLVTLEAKPPSPR